MTRNNLYPPSVTPGIPKLGEKPKGWTQMTFGKIIKPIQRKVDLADEEKYQLVVARRNRGGIVPRSILKGREIKTKNQYYIRENDFLIAKRQIIHGACGVVPKELNGAIVSGEYSVLNVKEGLLLDYLKYYCHTIYFQQTCFQSSIGVDVEKMIFRLEEWFRWPVYLPPLPEQRKIAEILSTWDETIAAAERLIATLHQRKQGLMQRLLTGQVRFPGFKGEWRKVALGEMGRVTSGGTPSRTESAFWDGDIQWATPTDITKLKTKYIEKTLSTITEKGLANSSAVLLPTGSLLVCTRASIGGIAINLVPMATNQGFKNLTPSKEFESEYIFHLLEYYKNILVRYANGSTFLELSKKDFEKIYFLVPELVEQKKIAEILNACDTEIELLQTKVTILKKQKKGLMQRLPTGEVRVKV
jgi:type I restriction enzyme S subunit